MSDIQRSGARLDRRAELVRLAPPLLDQGVSESEVHAALQEFVQHKKWGYLSPVTLEGIVESALDALVDAEMEEEAAQREVRLAPEADDVADVAKTSGAVTLRPELWASSATEVSHNGRRAGWPSYELGSRRLPMHHEAAVDVDCLTGDF
ncbi:MAG: hypothetical protein JWN70_5263 [Planctomycetaceae bacterium]|nr:hypothetical protein [Planctomycetaceae bacterium]